MFSSWLNKPYPLITRTKDKLLLVFGFGVFTALFLILYEPFGAGEVRGNRTLFLAGIGGCVALGLAINYFITPFILKKVFRPERWQIKKEIVYLASSFVIIAFFNYLYNTYEGKDIAPYFTYWEFLGKTFSIGIFPLLGLLFLTEKFLSQKHQAKAGEPAQQIQDQTVSPAPKHLTIQPETQKTPTWSYP